MSLHTASERGNATRSARTTCHKRSAGNAHNWTAGGPGGSPITSTGEGRDQGPIQKIVQHAECSKGEAV